MKKQWKTVKTAILLVALPLFATAAASAHQWMNDNSPLNIDLEGSVVSTPSDQLSSVRLQSVALTEAGAVEGRIAAIDSETKETTGLAGLNIYFIRDGKVVSETKTDDAGTFTAEGLTEGAYSFVATGKSGFAAYGVQVVPYDGVEKKNIMEAAAVSPDSAVIKKILTENLPAKVADQIVADSDEIQAGKVVGANRVRLNDGTLNGHIVPLVGSIEIVEGTQIHILKDGEEVAEVQADKTGSFMVPDLEPGVYDFVADGTSGIAAVSFEAVDEKAGSVMESTDAPADSEAVPVSLPAQEIVADDGMGYADSLDVGLTGGADYGVVADQFVDQGFVDQGFVDQGFVDQGFVGGGCSTCGGGCSTCGGGLQFGGGAVGTGGGCSACQSAGFAGGFSGGGRRGGLGRLLGLAALGIGITALADNPSNPPAASPSS